MAVEGIDEGRLTEPSSWAGAAGVLSGTTIPYLLAHPEITAFGLTSHELIVISGGITAALSGMAIWLREKRLYRK